MEIDIRVWAAFQLRPDLFQALRNENYNFWRNANIASYRKAIAAMYQEFPTIADPNEPDLLDAIIDGWDDVDRWGGWP